MIHNYHDIGDSATRKIANRGKRLDLFTNHFRNLKTGNFNKALCQFCIKETLTTDTVRYNYANVLIGAGVLIVTTDSSGNEVFRFNEELFKELFENNNGNNGDSQEDDNNGN